MLIVLFCFADHIDMLLIATSYTLYMVNWGEKSQESFQHVQFLQLENNFPNESNEYEGFHEAFHLG